MSLHYLRKHAPQKLGLFSHAVYLPTWLRGLRLSELQCSEHGWLAGWLVRQGVGSSPAPAGMSSQVSACYEIILQQVQRVRLCPL